MSRRARSPIVVVAVLVLAAAPAALATTWADVEVTCPICGTVNVFQAPASYGSYVYEGPSRLQYVFWPATTDRFVYTCRQCHFTAYMGDFQDVPDAKISAIASMLEREGSLDGDLVPYYDIPMPARLALAEKVYRLLDRDAAFWCEFHRIEGYHLDESGKDDEAKRARLDALGLVDELVSQAPGARKESLFIGASMRYFTGDASGASTVLAEAKGLTYQSAEHGSELSDRIDGYLSDLITDLENQIRSLKRLD